MTRTEVIARLKANREAVSDVEKCHTELRECCRRDRMALTIAINQLERAERKRKQYDKLPKVLNFVLITLLGILLTKIGMQIAYMERGYFAVGGEMLILPFTYMVCYGIPELFRGFKKMMKEWKELEEREEKDDE